ncbi:Pyrroline-5-carboxylate reductase [Pigmentiphaga humi]|uniref:Pyrroline-5-carboxylate reductase n=1 Tax=Pigmentiphaga humi TaxID=2478468 RepID=A0A3P4B8V0_9BURK|nr:pyrroline-5-carboxylate reductase [Pigmentiphaga humi]VCU72482.1 Pyrroline-5-carboxylate reductase [Pigmentiphaga humi]
MNPELSIAFIGGGNMAAALISGLAGKFCPIGNIHVIDPVEDTRKAWAGRGATVAAAPDEQLSRCNIWVLAVKPQIMKSVAAAAQPWLRDSLVISIAAGIRAADLAGWLGAESAAWPRVVRCMPNTPALIGQGVTGLAALDGVGRQDRELADAVLKAVGQTVWVDRESDLDGVTALSGSGPAYVFLFLEALIEGGQAVGLSAEQSRALALATFTGAASMAAASAEPPALLRERVTSKGGTTAAALDVMAQADFRRIVARAMQAAAHRAQEMGDEFSK